MSCSSCSDCIKGVLHDGVPQGSIETIAGVQTYVATPPAGLAGVETGSAVLYLGDVFGFYNNSKLLCDSYAANGFTTYFPDYLNGDQLPLDAMNSPTFDMAVWRVNHTEAHTRKPLDAVIKELSSRGITKLYAAGYCFGGKYAVDLAIENKVVSAMVAHPSGIVVPTSLESLLQNSKSPLLIHACEFDKTWPAESQATAEKMLGSSQYTPGFKQVYHPGCTHGFASRGDLSIEAVKLGKERAFTETVAWFRKST